MEEVFNSASIYKIFRMAHSRQTLLNAEESGLIPKAGRKKRGTGFTRIWTVDDLPEIGARYGQFHPLGSCVIFSVYTAKGGVLKTTLSYNFARILALHGLRVLIVGLDLQGSVTEVALSPLENAESLTEIPIYDGLFPAITKEKSVSDVIIKTNLRTLQIIPETPELTLLDRHIQTLDAREFTLKSFLTRSLRDQYDVIIFDNGPGWNNLIGNSLVAADYVISPIGCDYGTYQVLDNNLNTTFDFQEKLKLNWKHFFLVPTLLENNKISKQINAAYINKFPDMISNSTIRRATKGQDASTKCQSILEYDPTSQLANDYYELTKEIWDCVSKIEKVPYAN